MPTPLLEVCDVHKSYGSVHALGGVSIDCQPGEVLGLLGPNGAGKSTLISIISAMVPPDSGSVTLNGGDVLKDEMAAKRVLGVVPQDLALYDSLTGRENLRFFGELYGVKPKDISGRVEAMIARMQLEEQAGRRVGTFSGGMKRRINIGASLLHDPPLLLLDEPTVGIDPQTRNAIFDLVEELQNEGMAVIYTTHYMEEAQRLCDRIAIIDHGKIIAVGTIPELLGMVTAADTVHFDFNDPVELDTDHLRIAVNGIETVTVSDRRLTVAAKGSEALMPDLIGAVKAAGLEPQSMTIEKPNLESVFLALTGRQLREG